MTYSWATHATRSSWQTADEQAFLDHLGTHTEHQSDRPTLLRRYRAAMGHRVTWGAVDDVAVRAYVEALLTPEEPHV